MNKMKLSKMEIPLDISFSSMSEERRGGRSCGGCDCSCSHYQETRTWVKIVAWIHVIFGVICAIFLIWDVNHAIHNAIKSADTHFGIEFAPDRDAEDMESKMASAKLNMGLGLSVKILRLVSYVVKAIMGIFLLHATKRENPKSLQRWMLVMFLALLLELVIITPILVISEKFDYVGFLCWTLPLWILTIVFLFVVHAYRDDLQNYNISAESSGSAQSGSDSEEGLKSSPSSKSKSKSKLEYFRTIV